MLTMEHDYITSRMLQSCSHLNRATMPIESPYPPVTVPEVDVWTYYLERADREYPDDHGEFIHVFERSHF
jgi:hypothetical protein